MKITLGDPVFAGYSKVWSPINDDDPYYKIYYCGTNCFKIMSYDSSNDEWVEVELDEVVNLYGLFWKMVLEIDRLKQMLEKDNR